MLKSMRSPQKWQGERPWKPTPATASRVRRTALPSSLLPSLEQRRRATWHRQAATLVMPTRPPRATRAKQPPRPLVRTWLTRRHWQMLQSGSVHSPSVLSTPRNASKKAKAGCRSSWLRRSRRLRQPPVPSSRLRRVGSPPSPRRWSETFGRWAARVQPHLERPRACSSDWLNFGPCVPMAGTRPTRRTAGRGTISTASSLPCPICASRQLRLPTRQCRQRIPKATLRPSPSL
mmetsp:Transcript_23272/g.60914  ORF Transcript_23272/g.60914 Transcript_23272/m.60914 type:complete len:233 (+) Transcript_23272:1230-1928(+)